MNIELPDNIQDEKGYLGHTFSKLEALCDIQILALRGIELSVRKLALRWGWKQTRVFEFLQKSEHQSEQKANTSITENQDVTRNSRTKSEHQSEQNVRILEKETLPPNNNIIITPIKEKEKGKENKPLNIFTDISPTKEKPPSTPKSTPRFVPPTIEQIKEYAALKNITQWVDAENFWNFYDSKNWYVGKNKMVRWRSAVSGWALRQKERQQQQFNSNDYANNRTTGNNNGQQFANAQERENWLISRLSRKYKGVLDE